MATTTKIYRREPYSLISPSNPANNHAGKTVLINGSTAGIGFAIAQAFVQANASKVILTGRGPEGLESAAAKLASITSATTIQTFVCDLSLESSVENLWQRLKLEDIRVDILVLNAADTGSGSMLPVKNFMSKMQGAFKTNVWGNMTMASRFLDQAIDEGQAKQKILINIASFMAHSNPAPFQAAYSTSKAAFAHTMQLLADEVPEDECQIINVHPGAILTEAAQKELPQEAKDAVAWDNSKVMPSIKSVC